jgi:uncharacterized membrane protein
MRSAWALAGLIGIVGGILWASRKPRFAGWFKWLPVPLWCYALPVAAVAVGWLPRETVEQPFYRSLTSRLLPFALSLLLLGADLPSVARTGWRALIAFSAGALGIVLGAPLSVWLLHAILPTEAWKGAGALAGTWTGGTMNLLALRSVLAIPETIFAPLIIVDALIAYGWMALLVAASGLQGPINRWLGAEDQPDSPGVPAGARAKRLGASERGALFGVGVIALLLSLAAQAIGARLPKGALISSASGWTVLLVTTGALALSFVPAMRRLGSRGGRLGYPCLYLVLAATGAQAGLEALWSAPAWVAVGLITVAIHGAALVIVGRLLRIPIGLLATASQANIGGMVSGPLVGAVYRQSLAPVGLLLAVAGNAVGTYLGVLAATLCGWIV